MTQNIYKAKVTATIEMLKGKNIDSQIKPDDILEVTWTGPSKVGDRSEFSGLYADWYQDTKSGQYIPRNFLEFV